MNEKIKAIVREYAESLVIAFVLAMIIRTFVVQAYKIPTGSMIPTLNIGDRILVCKFLYWFREPRSGEIVVFKYPEDPKLAYIKRLAALGGQTLEIRDQAIYVNGAAAVDPRLHGRPYVNSGAYGGRNRPYTVPADSYYVLGDNSENSRDSRYWGPVPKRNMIGKALIIYWPLHRIRGLH